MGQEIPNFKAFASSTCEDLKEHRAHVIRAPRKADISEWEYSCRAGMNTRNSFGDAIEHSFQQRLDGVMLDRIRHVQIGMIEAFVPTWSGLQKLAESKVLRSSYYWLIGVPLAAKALSHMEDPLRLRVFGNTFQLSLDLPFSWQLFYYAALSIAIAGIWFNMKCPRIIRHYNSYDEFRTDGCSDTQMLVSYLAAYQRLQYYPEMRRESIEVFTTRYTSGTFPEGIFKELDNTQWVIRLLPSLNDISIMNGQQIDAFFYVQRLASLAGLKARLVCVVLYSLGLVLLACVLFQNFMYVYSETVR